jgi:hypothetical protein
MSLSALRKSSERRLEFRDSVVTEGRMPSAAVACDFNPFKKKELREVYSGSEMP